MDNRLIYTQNKKKPDIRELTIANGLAFPSDTELLMLILGSGTKNVPVGELSQKALEAIEESDESNLIKNLTDVTGLGINKALSVAAALEFGRRHYLYRQAIINSPLDIIPFVRHYALSRKENFVCTLLSGAREIIDIYVVSTGTSTRTLVQPREVFAPAIEKGASAIICCHNHPNGLCEPSANDIETTNRLRNAAGYLGIAFLDHLILTETDYFSFREKHMLSEEDLCDK